MPSAAWPGVQWKAIELSCLPRVAQDAKHCMAWGAIEESASMVLMSMPKDYFYATYSAGSISKSDSLVDVSLRLIPMDYFMNCLIEGLGQCQRVIAGEARCVK